MPLWRRRKKNADPIESAGFSGSPSVTSGEVDPDLPSGIRPGITRPEVVDVLGPPLDSMDMAEFTSRAGGGAASVVLRGRMPDQTFWLYNDVPDSGVEITMTFENGLLATARMKPYDVVAPQESERQGWARDLMLEHVDRVTREFPDQRLTARPGWARLVEPDVLDFVLNTFASPRGGGLVGRQARRFGELDLIVSLYEFGEAERIRAAMPAGYPAQLASLAESFGLTQQRLDIAHWILGREPGGVGAVHLGYIPSAKDITGLLPTDLLSAEERESHLG